MYYLRLYFSFLSNSSILVYNFRLTNQYAAILPSTDCEQDNVSNNSKTSNDMSSSFLSELTCKYFRLP